MATELNWEEFENEFNVNVRNCVTFFILFLLLQFLSYSVISLFKKRQTDYSSDLEDAVAYKVSFWACNFSFSICLSFTLLLPMCIMNNEILLLYPDNYILWHSMSFMQDIWNLAFFLSNLAIFVLLPFAYFFSESQGFSSSYTGIRGRIHETCCVLVLSMLLIIGLIFTVCSIFGYRNHAFVTMFDSWNGCFQFLYSFVRFLGVLLLFICTPIGFTCLFTYVGKLVLNKSIIMDMQAEYLMAICERKNILVKLEILENDSLSNHQYATVLKSDLQVINKTVKRLDSSLQNAKIHRFITYPVAMTFLLYFTIRSVVMVIQNILKMLIFKSMPIYPQHFSLGISSLSAVGLFLKIILILYIWCSSLIGLYTLPFFRHIKPKVHKTPMTHMIGNCVLLLISSSALPVLTRAAEIMHFDLSQETNYEL